MSKNLFYEWVKYDDNYYGTGIEEWRACDIFIMETDGVDKIKLKDINDCLIIYVNTPLESRLKRMYERGWPYEKILTRMDEDRKKFQDFKKYDLEIASISSKEHFKKPYTII